MELQKENNLLLSYKKVLNKHGMLIETIEGDSPLLSDVDYHLSNVVVVLCEQGTARFDYDFTAVRITSGDIFIGLRGI